MGERTAYAQTANDAANLLDENEQLRTELETVIEENTRLIDDRDRLLVRVSALSRDLQRAHEHYVQSQPAELARSAASERQSQTDEELRVAFEELQVLAEELEVTNAGLQDSNRLLDARVVERTRELHDSNAALRRTETSFHSLANLVPDLLWRTDAGGTASWFNQRWFERIGQDTDAPFGHDWLDAVHEGDRATARSSWARALENGAPYERELRFHIADGSYRWFLVRAERVNESAGRGGQWFVAGTDVHEQRVALEALRHGEERFRTLVENMPQLVWRSRDGGDWTWSSPQWQAYAGLTDAQSRGAGWLDALHPDDRDKARKAWAVAAERGVFEAEARIGPAGGERYRHFHTRALPVCDADGGVREWIGTSTDVDDMIQLQKRQSVLVGELQHRTRNLMAVVQAVTMRTLKASTSLEEFREHIDERLQALARVQGLLSRRAGARVSFDALLRAELSAHIDLDESATADHVTLDGPEDVALPSSIVQTLALALHELATNAVKYGALSRADARLDIRWEAHGSGTGPTLSIDWRETGVTLPPGSLAAAPGSGYGRELIERVLPYQLGAQTAYAFTPDGLHCAIAVLLPDHDEHQGDDA